jgi:hypothetical protein
MWQMDPGNSQYQNAWLTSVAAELSQHGWDGVMLDDANSTERYHLCGRTIAKYPTESDYEAATRSFLARVGPALTSQGFLALPNINFDCWETCWSNYIQYTSGAIREWWTKSGTGYGGQYSGNNWDWANGFLRLTQQRGKIFIGITYAPGDDVRSQRYARASFLLDWDAGPSAMIFEPVPEAVDPWSSEWTADVGTPTSARYLVGSVWRRDYSGGTVLVNPSATTTATVTLGGSFVMPDGSTVTSATLGPTSGLVLRSAPTSSPPPPPPPAPAPAPAPAPTPSAPISTALPTIVALQGGQSVAGSSGTWTGSPTPTFAYQWLRCDSKGGACAPISGATSTAFVLGGADIGSTLRFKVTATNSAGSAVAQSASTGVVSGSAKNPKVRALA